MNLLLKNVTWENSSGLLTADIRIQKNVIVAIGELQPDKDEHVLELQDHFIYAGLINAHDHLEMNLYPRLGNPPYNNYIEWSKDIYKPHQSPVKEIEKVNIKDRLLWGGLKCLIAGVTTAVHHNPWHSMFDSADFPVKVLKQMRWTHSLEYGKDILKEFSDHVPFIIHAAEGIDDVAYDELLRLDAMGLMKKNTVLVHGVGIEKDSEGRFLNGPFSIVWCPASNLFTFGKTAPVEKMKQTLHIALGTDSTMTGSATLLEEMRVALRTDKASERDIVGMVTTKPATMFGLPNPELTAGCPADLFITRRNNPDYFKNLLATEPRDVDLVVVEGNPRMHTVDILLSKGAKTKYHITVGGAKKLVTFDVEALRKRILKEVPRDILQRNPLWNLIEA
jgi:cytosine/adenosine deaminase-related metal-dependent hydrolase